jgi:hypothetical protein
VRIDADGQPTNELTLFLTPDEARQAVGVLNQLLAVVPSEVPVSENEFDDAPNEYVGGERTVRLVVYSDDETERRYDAQIASPS